LKSSQLYDDQHPLSRMQPRPLQEYSEGKAEGINEATKNIAINLAKENTTIDIIAKVTRLSE